MTQLWCLGKVENQNNSGPACARRMHSIAEVDWAIRVLCVNMHWFSVTFRVVSVPL